MNILIIGGAASGKSELAEALAVNFDGPRVYLATMNDEGDREDYERIERHHQLRAGKGFSTVECAQGLSEAIEGLDVAGATVLLEDLGNLVANELFLEDGTLLDEDELIWSVVHNIVSLENGSEALIVVANEVGADGLLYSEETADYVRVMGKLACALAADFDVVIETVAGTPYIVKGAERFAEGVPVP
ncbi:MAG: bifunctional adenosylcobinamide kinase/adenosylcobinamide-phosphate guanylyltransferase [Coriobacteriales bacterium]|jgi:adenosylcobinamide kinase/adenosylcobinamide-phosphate guanylyltransferase